MINIIYITGDTHGDLHRFSVDAFPEQGEMTKDDYVIILGDFGMVWDYRGESKTEKYWLDWLDDRPFTTLFLDGNHECFPQLESYPVEEWHGGFVHKIRPSVMHLMRGEIFDIEDKKFFVFGGASSHDIKDGILDPEEDIDKIKNWRNDPLKLYRINGRSWWSRELPSQEEMDNGNDNLAKHNNEVDYILTHCPPASVLALIGMGQYEQDVLTRYLEDVRAETKFTRMFSGHMHIDEQINYEHMLLYEQIIRII